MHPHLHEGRPRGDPRLAESEHRPGRRPGPHPAGGGRPARRLRARHPPSVGRGRAARKAGASWWAPGCTSCSRRARWSRSWPGRGPDGTTSDAITPRLRDPSGLTARRCPPIPTPCKRGHRAGSRRAFLLPGREAIIFPLTYSGRAQRARTSQLLKDRPTRSRTSTLCWTRPSDGERSSVLRRGHGLMLTHARPSSRAPPRRS